MTGLSSYPPPVVDPNFELSAGNLYGKKVIHKFAHASGIGTTVVDVWLVGGVRTWLTVPSTLEAISDNAGDTAVGAGARVITVEGLNANFDEITEDITMAGLGVSSPTINTFIRVNRAYVKSAGTYGGTIVGGNLGIILVRLVGAGASQISINKDTDANNLRLGQSQSSHYTIPRGKTGYMLKYEAIAEVNTSANIILFKREGANIVSAPFSSPRVQQIEDGVAGTNGHSPVTPMHGFPEMTDIWFSAKMRAGTGTVSIAYEIELVDNPL